MLEDDYAAAGIPMLPNVAGREVPGVKLQVLGFDSQFQLTNRSTQTVTVFGYDGQPYARILPNGTVEQNHLSPAT